MHCAVPARGTIDCAVTRVTANGSASAAHFIARYDGRRYAVTGAPEMDNVSLRHAGRSTVAIFSKGPRPVYGYRIEPSLDGRRLTIRSIDPRTYRTLYSIVRYDRKR